MAVCEEAFLCRKSSVNLQFIFKSQVTVLAIRSFFISQWGSEQLVLLMKDCFDAENIESVNFLKSIVLYFV